MPSAPFCFLLFLEFQENTTKKVLKSRKIGGRFLCRNRTREPRLNPKWSHRWPIPSATSRVIFRPHWCMLTQVRAKRTNRAPLIKKKRSNLPKDLMIDRPQTTHQERLNHTWLQVLYLSRQTISTTSAHANPRQHQAERTNHHNVDKELASPRAS